MNTLDLTADIIDLRDIIERFEEVETELLETYNNQVEDQLTAQDGEDEDFIEWLSHYCSDEADEYRTLKAILVELNGCGGDEQWRGDWYPLILIKDSYFTDYCIDLIQDIGDLPRDIPSYLVIDWDATADNLRYDYSETSIGDNDYLFR